MTLPGETKRIQSLQEACGYERKRQYLTVTSALTGPKKTRFNFEGKVVKVRCLCPVATMQDSNNQIYVAAIASCQRSEEDTTNSTFAVGLAVALVGSTPVFFSSCVICPLQTLIPDHLWDMQFYMLSDDTFTFTTDDILAKIPWTDFKSGHGKGTKATLKG